MATIQRLDAMAAALRKKQVGKVTRADVLRLIISTGLQRLERDVRGKERPR